MQDVSFFKCTALLLLCALCLIIPAKKVRAGDATVYWTQGQQKISGFGASSAWMSGAISDNLADFFFKKDTGIGLSILRTRIPPDGIWEPETGAMLKAKARGVTQIWSTAWTPPVGWKINNDPNNPVSGGALQPGHYRDYANYLAQYIKDIKNNYGVELYAISIQNEPDLETDYESCLWNGEQFRTFIREDLRLVFAANSITTKVMMPESAGGNQTNLNSLAYPTLNDSYAAAGVNIIATHLYGIEPYAYSLPADKEYWETEISDFADCPTPPCYDATMTSGLKYAELIHNCLTIARMNAFHYWWLAPMPGDGNQGLIHWTGPNIYEIPKRTYCLGNFSKFIRPGYYRVAATAQPTTNVFVSAYKNESTGDFVIVAINKNTSSITQKFVLNNFTAGTVTPWITSGALNLAQQGSIGVSGNAFSYTLPAQSVCSFVGTAAKITVTSPASGEDWSIDSNRTIEWTSSYITGTVTIKLVKPDTCGTELDIPYGTNTANDSSHPWKVAGEVLDNYKIRVKSDADPTIYGEVPFNIVSSSTTTSIRPTTTSIRPTTTTTSIRPTTTTTSIRPTTTTTINQGPVWDAGFQNQAVSENVALNYYIPTATDLEGNTPVSYSCIQMPANATFYPLLRLFQWNPSYDAVPAGSPSKNFTIIVRTTDSLGNYRDGSFTVTVYNVNRAPSVTASMSFPGLTINQGETISLTASASDPDTGDSLTYTWYVGWRPDLLTPQAFYKLCGPSTSSTCSYLTTSNSFWIQFKCVVTDKSGATAEGLTWEKWIYP
jgi:glucuronoarabinoxylan endo-1,4-beta-xylanase